MRRRLLGSTMVAAAVLVMAGCGGDDAGSPADTVQAYFEVVRDGDAEAACGYLSSTTIERIESSGQDCPATLEALGFGDVPDSIEIGETTEDGDTATVSATADGEEEQVALVNEDGGWKVDFTDPVEGEADATPTEPEATDEVPTVSDPPDLSVEEPPEPVAP